MKGKGREQRRRHERDPYVRQSRRQGYRSRAAYKLLEIIERHRLVRSGMSVVELGCAPGGWSQVLVEQVGPKGRVVGIDILPMEALPGVRFLCGDFTDEGTRRELLEALDGARADLVFSDLAPNLSGIAAMDQPRSIGLAELAHGFSRQVLKPGGSLLVKVFQGEGVDALVHRLRSDFAAVRRCKPRASREKSRELYLLARSYGV